MVLGGDFGFEEAAADAGHGGLQHERGEVERDVELFRGAGEGFAEGLRVADAEIFDDAEAVDVGGDGVEGEADGGVGHLGAEEGVGDGRDHVAERLAAMGGAGGFHGVADGGEVAAECGLEQRGLVGEVLVEGADGDSGTVGDAGGGEALLADGDENLKRGFEDGFDSGRGAGLDRLFARLFDGSFEGRQMRTPKLKLPSSKHTYAEERCDE